MTTYTTATEDAATLRAELKKRGWTSKQVSVRSSYASMCSSIDVTLKDAAVPLETVKELAHRFEQIDRCPITGEILGGANRYVHVRTSREYDAAACAPFLADLAAALKRLESDEFGEREHASVGLTGFSVSCGMHGKGYHERSLWGPERHELNFYWTGRTDELTYPALRIATRRQVGGAA